MELGAKHPHGSNISKKVADSVKSGENVDVIMEVAKSYLAWRDSSGQIEYDESDVEGYVAAQSKLYSGHRDLLDEERVDAFDSRGALQPSALEEFCTFLFRPLLERYSGEVAVGHHLVYQRLFFSARNFDEFSQMPVARYPTGNLDFVIGKELTSTLEGSTEKSSQKIYIPAVAVECKTYLDRPRYIESDILARNIKYGFPRCLYILVSEYLKLDLDKVDVYGSQIDRIYVWRRSPNVDRKIRRQTKTPLEPIYVPAVVDFFCAVREHLREDWAAPEDWDASGILK